ncbi:MAG: hypothetical protein LBJ41_05825 [Treponema sp.]|jgi:hypothetical protein|nr:hypothetical protein [Treponema sp.]
MSAENDSTIEIAVQVMEDHGFHVTDAREERAANTEIGHVISENGIRPTGALLLRVAPETPSRRPIYGRDFPAKEYKARRFKIFKETIAPYKTQEPLGEIELVEAVYVGGELYVVPMQVYQTENPGLLKVVFLLSDLSFQHNISFADINNNNIRSEMMTLDRRLFYYIGSVDGYVDMSPVPRDREVEA